MDTIDICSDILVHVIHKRTCNFLSHFSFSFSSYPFFFFFFCFLRFSFFSFMTFFLLNLSFLFTYMFTFFLFIVSFYVHCYLLVSFSFLCACLCSSFYIRHLYIYLSLKTCIFVSVICVLSESLPVDRCFVPGFCLTRQRGKKHPISNPI